MQSMVIHSALAIKRQRERRDRIRKQKERRYSDQSSGSENPERKPKFSDTKVVTSIGMLHIGILALILGVFLIGAGFIPNQSGSEFSFRNYEPETVYSGVAAIALGIFLIILNKVLSRQEEDDLETYVARQLTRSRSGHKLERDIETGGLQTKQFRKSREASLNDLTDENLDRNPKVDDYLVPTTSGGHLTDTAPQPKHTVMIRMGPSGEMILERIPEEEALYVDERNNIQSPIYINNNKKTTVLSSTNGQTPSIYISNTN